MVAVRRVVQHTGNVRPVRVLELTVMHYGIQLTADLEIQLSDMVVNQRFVELLHRLTGFADAVHKHLHRRRQAFTRRSVRKRGVIQKRIDIPGWRPGSG